MTIARKFCCVGVLALAHFIATSVSTYAAQPCCEWLGGKYINLKTGKVVKPPKGAVAPPDGGITQAQPKRAAPADPYYRFSDRYYGYADPYRGYYDYFAVPPTNPGYTYGYVRPGGWR